MPGPGGGRLVVISGPSGVGKSSVLKRLLEDPPVPMDYLQPSVSATTRPPRRSETDGIDYHFLSHEEFAGRRRRGEFLECCEVFGRGHWYGTLFSEVTPGLKAGKWVVLEIDVQGALSVMKQFGDAITIFLRPPSLEVLEKRLRERRTEKPKAIHRRLEQARHELAMADHYAYQVVNDNVDRAVREICDILNAERRQN